MFTPLVPVGDAIYAALLLDTTLAALAPGGVFNDVPPDPTYPFIWLEVSETRQHGGLGTKPGAGALPEVDLRAHVYQSDGGTIRDAQLVMERVIQLLADPPSVTGYAAIAIFHDATIPLADEELNGQKVHELVGMFRLFVEEAP